MNPTVSSMSEAPDPANPIDTALRAIVGAGFGAETVEQLVNGEVEADIAVTNRIAAALKMLKETEQTSILLGYFGREEKVEAIAFASRYPNRVTAVPFVDHDEETSLAILLLQRITERMEMGHARPAGG